MLILLKLLHIKQKLTPMIIVVSRVFEYVKVALP